MHIHDEILSKYFLSDYYFQRKAEALELERQNLLENAFPRTKCTETGLIVIGANIEAIVIRALILSKRKARLREKKDKAERTLKEALKLISKRNSILLHVYYRTGITLTNKYELRRAKEEMLDALDRIKEKEDRAIIKEYMQQFR